MDLKHFKTLKTIIEAGGFLNASYKLNCTQSTVTFHIQQLEKEFSIKFFEKIGRKMFLTQEAKNIMPLIDNILTSYEQIKDFNFNEMSGTLKVAMPETLLIYKIQNVLKVFKEKAPNVKLHLQSLNCAEIRNQIINGTIDLGIHYDIGGYTDSIITEKLNDFELTLIASSSLGNRHFDFVSEKQQKPFSIISNDSNGIYIRNFLQYLDSKNIVLDNIIELGSIEAVKKSISSNLGVAYVPKFTVEIELQEEIFVELENNIKYKKINTIYSYHKNKNMTKPMNLFIELLHKSLND
ncbi:LysR family transcriptional regulator [Malaciobacter marinus]|uniref:LysR family transcriptional regulator n=1 Tax=Malaciobacter marinus TaxID=505249 RepID=UPI003B0018FE